MSKATKKKYVTREVLEDYVLPEGDQIIVRVLASKGNNLHEVEADSKTTFLVSMPTKFRKNVWIKRGDFVIASPIAEGDKVKAEISNILYKNQIKYIKDQGLWPENFAGSTETKSSGIPDDMLPPSDESDSDDGEVKTFNNPNRPPVVHQYTGSSDSCSDIDDNL